MSTVTDRPRLVRLVWRWRDWRLAAGFVLYFYIASHFLNHALGLISTRVLVEAGDWFAQFWRFLPATIVLYGALLIHLGLVLWSIWRRRRFSLRLGEWVQMILGLCIVPLAAIHVIGTRLAHDLYGVSGDYLSVLLVTWHFDPMLAVQQTALLSVVWLHGSIGVYYWLRLRPWWPQAAPWLLAIAILIPVLGMLGYVQAAREVAERAARDPRWLSALLADGRNVDAAAARHLYLLIDITKWGFAGLVALTFGARLVRQLAERRQGLVRIAYGNGRNVAVPAGPTLLEISRGAGIPHASVCGGRGRCSTCRVRIGPAEAALPAPLQDELRVLARVGAPTGVRLACQLRLRPGNYLVTPLLPAAAVAADGFRRPRHHHGLERNITILFADLRGFTTLAEHRLPYDTVFLLNRYFRAMGEAIEEAGGRLDKFIGDGVMALFGLDSDPAMGARQAIDAARRMGLALHALNESLHGDVSQPLRIGIGLHAGLTIVGEMGHGHARSLTAIGDAVNTASRLEGMSKELRCQLVVSQDVVDLAGLDLGQWPVHEVAVRGRQTAMKVTAIADAAQLTPIDRGPATPAADDIKRL